MKKKILFLLILFIPFMVSAEEVNLEWEKGWGGSYGDSFNSIALLEENNLIVVGHSSSLNIDFNSDAILVKYDKDGNVLWQKKWGGNGNDIFNYVSSLNKNNFVVVGESFLVDMNDLTSMGNVDAIIVKYDKDGNVLWQKNYGGENTDSFNLLLSLDDESIIAIGSTFSNNIEGINNNGSSDAIIVKYDKDGKLLWQKNYGGFDIDTFNSIALLDDGGFVTVGSTSSNNIDGIDFKGVSDAIIVRYDKDGNIIWQKNYGGNGYDVFNSISLLEDGGFVAVGEISSTDINGITNKGNGDAIIVKYDQNGNIIWQKNYGGSSYDVFNSSLQVKDYGFIVVGDTLSENIDGLTCKGYDSEDVCHDAIIVRYDKNGNIIWQNNYGGNNYDSFMSTLYSKDGNFFAIGKTLSTDIANINNKGRDDAFILKYLVEYKLTNVDSKNGTFSSKQKNNLGIVTSTPNEGYEVDEIIVKDENGNVMQLEMTKLEDGTYSFPLYSDVSVEVLFKEILSNPKTGVFDYISFIMIGLLISFIGYISISYNNQKFEL